MNKNEKTGEYLEISYVLGYTISNYIESRIGALLWFLKATGKGMSQQEQKASLWVDVTAFILSLQGTDVMETGAG